MLKSESFKGSHKKRDNKCGIAAPILEDGSLFAIFFLIDWLLIIRFAPSYQPYSSSSPQGIGRFIRISSPPTCLIHHLSPLFRLPLLTLRKSVMPESSSVSKKTAYMITRRHY